MEDQVDDTARARPGERWGGGGAGGPAGPGGGGAPRRRESPRSSLGSETPRSRQHLMERGAKKQPMEEGAKKQPMEEGVDQESKEGVNATSRFTTPQAAPAQAKGCSSAKLAAAGNSTADAGDGETTRPWRHFNAAAYQPAPPKPTRIITDPRRPASGLEMWTRAAINREEIDYTIQFEKLSKSIGTIGSGISKVCAGLGVKIILQEEKDAAAAAEKKVVEAKKAAEEKMLVEEKALAAELSVPDFEERMKKKEEEKRKEAKDKEKERRIALLLSIPGHMVNISSVLDGLADIASGSKEAVVSMSLMVRTVPSWMRRVRGGTEGVVGGSSKYGRMGTGSLGMRMALDIPVITRAYDGRVSVLNAFGAKKETVSRAFGGTLLIHNEAELYSAILDFRNGRLRQLIDIDQNHVSLLVARDMWRTLCNAQLTGLLRPNSLLPEMALRATALVDEESALESHLQDAEKAVKELTSCISELRDKLEMTRDKALKAKGKEKLE